MPVIDAHGRKFHVGGRRTPSRYSPRLWLGNYLNGGDLPQPPKDISYVDKGIEALRQVYLNDELGDCVVAGAAHMIGVWTGNSGPRPSIFGDWALKNAYHDFSGGLYPESDSGCDEEYALNVWTHKGFAPAYANQHRIVAWVAVDAANVQQVKTAIWLFGGVMSGAGLPDAWINPPPSGDGFTFDAAGAPNLSNGHCMTHFSYDDQSIGCATWGMYGRLTFEALAKYFVPSSGGALYAAISADALIRATQTAPNGFKAADLIADARKIGFVHQ